MNSSIKKIASFIVFSLLVWACNRDKDLNTMADFLSRDNSDSRLIREYKTWEVAQGTIEIPGKPTIIYKKGEPIQNKFNLSKVTFVFNSNSTFQNTDETGRPGEGRWFIKEDGKELTLEGGSVDGTYSVIQITKNNFDFKNEESYDENQNALVTIKMIPKR